MSETIGLDIGSHSIKLVGLEVTSKGPFLTHVGIKEIPHGGQKDDPALISEIVKALYRECGLKPGKVRLTVSGTGVHIARITIPSMPRGELKEAVRWEMKNRLPYPIASAQIDFHILAEFAEKDSKHLDIIAVACPTHLIDRILSIAEGAMLKPVHINVSPCALWNALLALGSFEKDEGIALIDLGAEKTGIYLFRDGILEFTREVAPSGADISRAIMEGIDSQEDPSLLYEEAERIKKTIGIPSKDSLKKNGDPSINLSKIPFLVRPVLEKLIAEMGRSLDYYKNRFQVKHIDRLLLTGGGADLKNVSSCLSEELQLPVERFNPFKELLFDANRIDPHLLDQIGPGFTIALGIALPESRPIEFLPAKEPYWSRPRMEKVIPRLSLLATCLVFLWIFWHMSGQVTSLSKERDEKVTKARTIEMLQAKLTLLKEKETQIKRDLSLLPSSVVAPAPFRRALREIAHIVPSHATVTLLSIQSKAKRSDEKPPRNEGNELQLKGLAFGNDSQCLTALARMIEGLEKSPLFKNATLVSADENTSYNIPGIGFEIICDIELDHPSPPSFRKQERGEFGEEKQ